MADKYLHVYSQDSVLYEDKRFKRPIYHTLSLRHFALLFGIEAKRNETKRNKAQHRVTENKCKNAIIDCCVNVSINENGKLNSFMHVILCVYTEIPKRATLTEKEREKERNETQSVTMEKP